MSRGPVVVLTRAPCSAPFRSELPTPTERNADLRTRRRWQVVRDFRDFVTKFVESGEAASWAVDLGRVRANEGPSELGDGNWQGSDLLPLCRGRKSGPLNPKPGFCCLFWPGFLGLFVWWGGPFYSSGSNSGASGCHVRFDSSGADPSSSQESIC